MRTAMKSNDSQHHKRTGRIEQQALAGVEQIERAVAEDRLDELIEEYPEYEETIRLFADL